MKAGTPFTHFDVHAEEGGEYSTYKLPKRNAMGTYKAVVIEFLWQCIKDELKTTKHINIIFDGTTRIGEVQCIIFRYVVDKDVLQNIHYLKEQQQEMWEHPQCVW